MSEYPDGKLKSDDLGELIGALQIVEGRVILEFGKSITWVAFEKETLRSFIDALEDKYDSI